MPRKKKTHHSRQDFTCPVCGQTADGPLARGLITPIVCDNHKAHDPVKVKLDGGKTQTRAPVVLMRPLPEEVRDLIAADHDLDV